MIVNRPGLAIAAITALVFCFLPPSEPALALTMGVLPPNPLEADSIVQFLGVSPVAIPPPAPSSFSQAVGANPPDFAKSLFQRSILDLCSTCQPIASGTANIAMGAVTFGAFVSSAGDNVASAATAIGSFVDDLMVNPPAGVSGNGTILVPLHVTGSVGIVSTTVVGQPPILTQAGFSIFCATSTLSGPGGGVCGGSNPIAFSVSVPHPSQFIFDHSQPVDMSLLLTVPFTFGQEFLLDRQVWFTAGGSRDVGSGDGSGCLGECGPWCDHPQRFWHRLPEPDSRAAKGRRSRTWDFRDATGRVPIAGSQAVLGLCHGSVTSNRQIFASCSWSGPGGSMATSTRLR